MTQKDYYDFREDGETRQVSLEKLLRCAFRKWKLILLMGILLGCFFGAYKILSIHSKKDAMIKAYDAYKASLEMYNTNVADYNRTIQELQASITERFEYLDTAPSMQVDPYNCPLSTAQLRFVPADDSEITADDMYSMLYGVYDEIYYGDTSRIVAERQNMSSSNLNELLNLKIYTQGGTLTVMTRGLDEAQAESIRDDLIDVIVSRKDIFANYGEFDIEVFGKGTLLVVDSDIKTLQDNNKDSLTRLQTSLRTSQNQLAQLVKPASVPQYSKKYMLKNGIKLGIVGFIGGACLTVIALICLILFRGAVLSTDEIDGEYGLRTLADLSGSKSDDGSRLDYLSARIERLTEGKNGASIGVVGTISRSRLDALAAKLNEISGRSSDGLRFVSIPGLMKDAKSYRSLKDMDSVILAEEIGKSDYNNIRKEIALIADSDSEILGTVYY